MEKQPIEDYIVSLEQISKEQSPKNIGKQILDFFPVLWRRIYNTYLLFRYAELRKVASKNICPMRWIHTLPTLLFTLKIVTKPTIMKAILKYPRKDPEEGLFDDRENGRVFLPILQDMYPDENIEADDFLMTCHKKYVQLYRRPILQFIGPQNIRKHAQELENIVKETACFWSEKQQEGRLNATELTFVFTTTVISKLLLGHPGPFDTYRDIAYAIDFLNRYIIKFAWKQPMTKEEKQRYKHSLEIVRQAIQTSLTTEEKPAFGSLVDALHAEQEMTDAKIKTTLFLMYLGGSENSASLLNYLLWQLGQHPEYQEEIFKELNMQEGDLFEIASKSETIGKLFAESIRLFTPAYVIGRQLAGDLKCEITNKKGELLHKEIIRKKEGILNAPTFAAKDPDVFKDPDSFCPHRFPQSPKTFSWLPFGDGKHGCPGQWLVKAEISALIAYLVQHYEIQSFPEKEMKQKGYMTLKPDGEVYLNLNPRNPK